MEKTCSDCAGSVYCLLENDNHDVEVVISEAWTHCPHDMSSFSEYFVNKEDEIEAARYVMNCIRCACNQDFGLCNRHLTNGYCENFEAMVK